METQLLLKDAGGAQVFILQIDGRAIADARWGGCTRKRLAATASKTNGMYVAPVIIVSVNQASRTACIAGEWRPGIQTHGGISKA